MALFKYQKLQEAYALLYLRPNYKTPNSMKVHEDILNQAQELSKSLNHQLTDGKKALKKAAKKIKKCKRFLICGIGASHHAGLALQYVFEGYQVPCQIIDASELLYFYEVDKSYTILFLSRSGKSVEVLKAAEKAKKAGATIISITNDPTSPLAIISDIPLWINAAFDNNISITMYTAIIQTGVLLALQVGKEKNRDALLGQWQNTLLQIPNFLQKWEQQLAEHAWLEEQVYTIFLARGSSLGSAKEAELLWQEAAKSLAGSMPTGNFIHGPQEMLKRPVRFCIWLGSTLGRTYDVQLIKDLLTLGKSVLVIGYELPQLDKALLLELPVLPTPFQAVVDSMPVQLAAIKYAQKIGEDAASFLYCNYIVEQEGGIL